MNNGTNQRLGPVQSIAAPSSSLWYLRSFIANVSNVSPRYWNVSQNFRVNNIMIFHIRISIREIYSWNEHFFSVFYWPNYFSLSNSKKLILLFERKHFSSWIIWVKSSFLKEEINDSEVFSYYDWSLHFVFHREPQFRWISSGYLRKLLNRKNDVVEIIDSFSCSAKTFESRIPKKRR